MRYRLVLACLATLTLGVDLAHAQCTQAQKDTRAEGRLTVGRFSDAAGRPETAYHHAPIVMDVSEIGPR